MTIRLSHNAYGKHCVRVSKIKRDPKNPAWHEFIEASVNVTLQGNLDDAYLHGDNRNVVATDTCKNTVYVVAKDDPLDTIESFGLSLANHFLRQYSHLNRATIDLREHRWHRLNDCPHGFTGSDAETPTATIDLRRDQPARISSGIDQLMLAKTTETGFKDFHRDEFRTLPDTDDRILATVVEATWKYSSANVDFAAVKATAREVMLGKFLDHYSRSVQETLMLMAQAMIETCADIESVTLSMPNKHHIRVDLSPFGRDNVNEVFVVTDEPFGNITATVERQA